MLLTLIGIEHFVYFSSNSKKIILFSILGTFCFAFCLSILPRLLEILSPNKIKSLDKDILLISSEFKDIDDRLRNAYELEQMAENSDDKFLIAASLQKNESLSRYDFNKAIKYNKLKALIISFALTVCTFSTIIILSPQLKVASSRLVHMNVNFTKPSKFIFKLENPKPNIKRGEKVELHLSIKSKYNLEELYILLNNNRYLCEKISDHKFKYKIDEVLEDIIFSFQAEDEFSDEFKINVFDAAYVEKSRIIVQPPPYTGKREKIINQLSDLKLAYGSKISWELHTKETNSILLIANNKDSSIYKIDNNKSLFTKQFKQDTKLNIKLRSNRDEIENFGSQNISIIEDENPSIIIEKDEEDKLIFISGIIRDDYGFHSLSLLKINNKKDTLIENINISKYQRVQNFRLQLDKNKLAKENIRSFLFEIRDNDIYNAYKSVRTRTFEFEAPNFENKFKSEEKQSRIAQQSLALSEDNIDNILKKIDEIKMKLLQGKMDEWEKKSVKNELKKLGEELKKNINDLNKKQKDNTEKQLADLLKNDIDKLLKEIENLLKQNSKLDKLKDTEKLSKEIKSFKRKLERDKALYLQAKHKNLFDNILSRIDSIGKKNINDSKLRITGDILNQNKNKWFGIEKDIKKVDSIGSEIRTKYKFSKFQQDINTISKLNNQIEINKSNTNSEINRLGELQLEFVQLLKKKQQNIKSMSIKMDISAIRDLLYNLNSLSLKQEEIYENIKNSNPNSSNQASNINKISIEKQKYNICYDSIFSVSKRNFMLASMLKQTPDELIRIFKETEEYATKLRFSIVNQKQRYIITKLNDLSLIFSELLENLELQENESCKNNGEGSCNKPKQKGEGKNNFNKIEDMQKALEKMLGKIDKANKSGQKSKPGGENKFEQYGKALKELEELKKQIEDSKKHYANNPNSNKNLRELTKMIDQIGRQLSYFYLNSSTFERQKQSFKRFIEYEKASYEQKEEDKKNRSSKSILDQNKYKQKFDKLLKLNNRKQYYNEFIFKEDIELNDENRELYINYMINLRND
jgi:hypothetical protein